MDSFISKISAYNAILNPSRDKLKDAFKKELDIKTEGEALLRQTQEEVKQEIAEARQNTEIARESYESKIKEVCAEGVITRKILREQIGHSVSGAEAEVLALEDTESPHVLPAEVSDDDEDED